ncbi:MAG: HNH endonuclease [Dehalococcoidia bacterium]|jgi:hypothetical protein
MNNNRNMQYRNKWNELIEYYGTTCYYCRKEIATTIDHVVPYSWDQDNDIENLVPACALCNALAGNMMFESVDHKRQYILGERKKRVNQRAICTDCMLPFTYRTHSPSMFLCAECYDQEYNTQYSQTRQWRKWIVQLAAAGIPADAHRNLRRRLERVRLSERNRRVKIELLIDEYSYCAEHDDRFAEMLVYS